MDGLFAGADVNLSGASGLHALHLAAERGYTDIVHVLITAGVVFVAYCFII